MDLLKVLNNKCTVDKDVHDGMNKSNWNFFERVTIILFLFSSFFVSILSKGKKKKKVSLPKVWES